MSNPCVLAIKRVTRATQAEVAKGGLLAGNQLRTVALVQGAKERAMLNVAINREHGNVHTPVSLMSRRYLTQLIIIT